MALWACSGKRAITRSKNTDVLRCGRTGASVTSPRDPESTRDGLAGMVRAAQRSGQDVSRNPCAVLLSCSAVNTCASAVRSHGRMENRLHGGLMSLCGKMTHMCVRALRARSWRSYATACCSSCWYPCQTTHSQLEQRLSPSCSGWGSCNALALDPGKRSDMTGCVRVERVKHRNHPGATAQDHARMSGGSCDSTTYNLPEGARANQHHASCLRDGTVV